MKLVFIFVGLIVTIDSWRSESGNKQGLIWRSLKGGGGDDVLGHEDDQDEDEDEDVMVECLHHITEKLPPVCMYVCMYVTFCR